MKSIRAHAQDYRFQTLAENKYGTPEFAESPSLPLQIVVPFTTTENTKAALNAANVLAADMRARIVLLRVHVVPYPLPLDRPAVQQDFLLQQLQAVASESSLPVRVELVLARNKNDALRQFIPPGTLVLLVTRKRWWHTAEERLALTLVRQGCNVSMQTLTGGKADIPFFWPALGEDQERNGKVGRPHFRHVIQLQ